MAMHIHHGDNMTPWRIIIFCWSCCPAEKSNLLGPVKSVTSWFTCERSNLTGPQLHAAARPSKNPSNGPRLCVHDLREQSWTVSKCLWSSVVSMPTNAKVPGPPNVYSKHLLLFGHTLQERLMHGSARCMWQRCSSKVHHGPILAISCHSHRSDGVAFVLAGAAFGRCAAQGKDVCKRSQGSATECFTCSVLWLYIYIYIF